MTKKPTFIILPGWGGNELLWQYQQQHLQAVADTRVIVITDQTHIEKMADAILAQAPEQFILCGHSLGGWAAQWIALKAPERVSQLILLGTWTGASSPELLQLYQVMRQRIIAGEMQALLQELRPQMVAPVHCENPQIMAQLKQAHAQFPAQGLLNQTEIEIQGGDTAALLPQIHCPTLVIHGRQDSFFSLASAQQLQQKIPKARFVVIEDCGHMLSVEQPQAVTALLYLAVTNPETPARAK